MSTGADYRAQTRITAKDGTVLAAIGETCERVPEEAIGWLSDQELIVPVSAIAPVVDGPTTDESEVE